MEYRMTIYPDLDCNADKSKAFLFDTLAEMDAAKNCAADLLLFVQDDLFVMRDCSNIFICEQKINGEWEQMSDS